MWRTAPGKNLAGPGPSRRRQLFKTVTLGFEFFKITIRRKDLRAGLAEFGAPHRYQALTAFVGKRAQQYGIHNAEDGRGRAGSES